MVAWKNLFPDGSGPVGGVVSYVRVVTTDGPKRAILDGLGTRLSSGGVVDTNAPMRGQYNLGGPAGPAFFGYAGFSYDGTDVSNYPNMTATMFVAPASAVPTNPTVDQIRLAATEVIRAQGYFGSPSYRSTAGNSDYIFIGATKTMPSNTKYWIAVMPTWLANPASTPSIANDAPMYAANTHGRAASVWTNRTPLAPVITAPVGQTTVFPGSSVVLTFAPKDPDRVQSYPGDSGIPDFEDMAGAQVQYRHRASDDTPATEWVDLPINNLFGTDPGPGWWIDDVAGRSDTEGAYYMWWTRRLKIECGTRTGLAANASFLPAGDWEVRVRTFDYGHGRPDSANAFNPASPGSPPLNDPSHNYTPDTYPFVNTSPWSIPVRIFVNPQVPKPLALSPSSNIAVTDENPITFAWQYRNTYSPPFPQTHRVVQYKKAGEADWVTLVDDDSADTTFTMATPLVSGNQYMWRVKVTDGSGEVSEFSDTAYFWVVPAPASGEVIPTPTDTIDGATLGCGTHRVEVYRRGGRKRVGELTGITSLEWNRNRDDISLAKVTVKNWGVDCGNLLSLLEPWAYELVITRDNGYSKDRVWEGPITLLTYENNQVVVQAKDVMAYAYRRIIKQTMNDTGKALTAGRTVVQRAAAILQNIFAPDDPNLLPYLMPMSRDDDAKQYRALPAYSRTGFEEVDDMAANAGLDYTAVGRSILLWGTKHRIGTLPEFTDRDLGNSPIVSVYGMSMANVYAVSDGNGIYGEATRLDENGRDEKYGLIEMLSSTWASESESEAGTYTEEGLNTVRESFAVSAERSIADRYPPPVVVRVPDNTRVHPDVVLSIQQLVPGVVIPLRSTGTLRTVVASQKLDAVKVIETGGEETITITLSPFSRDDNDTGGEVE